MIRSYISQRVKRIAISSSIFLAFFLIMSVNLFAINDQWDEINSRQQSAVEKFTIIREEIYHTLVILNKKFEPNCSNENLRKIREYLFDKKNIGNVGIFNNHGNLLCTSVAGLLDNPIIVSKPDITIKAPNGQLVHFTVQSKSLIPMPDGTFSNFIKMGFFDVEMNSFFMDTLLKNDVTEISHIFPSKIIVIYKNKNKNKNIEKRINDILSSNPSFKINANNFLIKELAFLKIRRDLGGTTTFETIIPFMVFFNNYEEMLIFGWSVSLLISLLFYVSATSIFNRWKNLDYRILRVLIEKNIICAYQPIIDLKTLRPIGCEVLMRLRDGENILFPDVVLSAVIKRRLTWKLDQLVIKKAIFELNEKLTVTDEFKVAFNVFPENITESNMNELFKKSLQKTAHKGLIFELEILEYDYNISILEEINKLKKSGFLISVDDFGTGYSNLGSIKKISPNFLKIDRSFVQDMEHESLRSSLIPEIINIGEAVGSEIIAEGIENKRQLELLIEMGIPYGQGYLFLRPQPIDEFITYINEFKNEKCSNQN